MASGGQRCRARSLELQHPSFTGGHPGSSRPHCRPAGALRAARPSNWPWPMPWPAAIHDRQHLVVEAGTGVGKSFAYLVPAILATSQAEDGKDPPVERRHLARTPSACKSSCIGKDLPLLRASCRWNSPACWSRAAAIILSLRRMQERRGARRQRVSRARGIRPAPQYRLVASKPATARWRISNTGRWATCGTKWKATSGNCLGRKCPTYSDCFYYQRPAADAARPDSDRESRLVLQRPGPAARRGQHSARL